MINRYLFILTSKYILVNTVLVTILVLFLNILEISRLLESQNKELINFIILTLLKLPTIISETIPFIVIISIAFLFRNLISNNELISMRNVGFSILDIFKPVGITIFLFGLLILIFLNPISAKFEKKFNEIVKKDNSNIYTIRFIDEGMWIKNISDEKEINFININEINLNTMKAKRIKILNVSNNNKKIITAENGKIDDNKFNLNNVTISNIENNTYDAINHLSVNLNFEKKNIIDSISNYKFIPFYKYKNHINSLKKFNLYSSEISLYYLSEILKPIFLVIIGFVVMGFSGKFKRNENFFKILFISVLIGFLIFLLKEVIVSLTTTMEINFIISYIIILLIPLLIGMYQMIKIETD